MMFKIMREQQAGAEKNKWSQFVYPYSHGGEEYLFHTLTKQCWKMDASFCRREEYSARQIEGDEELLALMKGFFLVPKSRDECLYYEGVMRLLRTMKRKKGYKKYTILPTTGCNARCVYCFEEGRKQAAMSGDLTEKTISFILSSHRDGKPVYIEWFGGEPLLATEQIDRINNALRENHIEVVGSMVSNGSLVTDEIIEKMKTTWNIRSIQISMDGTEEQYIRRKQYYRYENEYRRVLENIARLAANGIFVNIRVNVDEDNAGDIPAFIQDLDEAFPDKTNISVYFVPLKEVRRSEACWKVWQKCLQTKEKLEKIGFMLKEEDLVLSPKVNYCIADDTTANVVISSDGSLYNCEDCTPGFSFGNVENGITDAERLRWYTEYGATREKCRHCVFLPECTSFSRCPIVDRHCQKVRDEIQKRVMRQIIAKKAKDEEVDEESLSIRRTC